MATHHLGALGVPITVPTSCKCGLCMERWTLTTVGCHKFAHSIKEPLSFSNQLQLMLLPFSNRLIFWHSHKLLEL